ncbi:hypothetical protein MRX96_051406 [Rhipicephalus microplus]
MNSLGTLTFDEYGRPFIILKDQDKKEATHRYRCTQVTHPGCQGCGQHHQDIIGPERARQDDGFVRR